MGVSGNRHVGCTRHHIPEFHKTHISERPENLLILTWHRGDRDRLGGSPRMRPLHCTTVGLTPAIIPNVNDSGAQFLLGGDCVRAIP